jgi:hypothetical protein
VVGDSVKLNVLLAICEFNGNVVEDFEIVEDTAVSVNSLEKDSTIQNHEQ